MKTTLSPEWETNRYNRCVLSDVGPLRYYSPYYDEFDFFLVILYNTVYLIIKYEVKIVNYHAEFTCSLLDKEDAYGLIYF